MTPPAQIGMVVLYLLTEQDAVRINAHTMRRAHRITGGRACRRDVAACARGILDEGYGGSAFSATGSPSPRRGRTRPSYRGFPEFGGTSATGTPSGVAGR